MSRDTWSFIVGIVMVVGGVALYFAFRDTETPIIGLRQAGAVIAVLGVCDVAATLWSKNHSDKKEEK